MTDVLAAIRAACARVAADASHVRIDHDRIEQWADEFVPGSGDGADEADPGRTRHGDDEATAAFVIALDAINFGSGYFPFIRKRPGMSGYFTIATSLRDYVDATGPLTATRLRRITPADCSQIFGQELDGGLMEELMVHFATALVDVGTAVDADHGGTFTGLVTSAGGSASRLVATLDRIGYFHDVASYRGFEVPIYKRAQIAAHDLAGAFVGEGLGRFDDLDRLTMFADNLVPHVLRVDGVLAFSPDLLARIEAVEDITSGSEPEVEIRACGLHAVELLLAELRARGHDLTAGRLDAILWTRGGRPGYKAVPRHRTRCVYY
jgi:hypothetical protein